MYEFLPYINQDHRYHKILENDNQIATRCSQSKEYKTKCKLILRGTKIEIKMAVFIKGTILA